MHARWIELRASLALAALAACGGGKSGGGATRPAGPPPEPGAPTAAAPPPSAPAPPLPGDGPRAFVADASGLVEIAAPGGTSQVVAPAASWCSVDARGKVVWFVTPRGLHAFDLTDRRTRTIIAEDLGELAAIIDWGNQRVGGESELAFDVGAGVRLSGAKPALEMMMGCDGDRGVYCYEDGDPEQPTAEVVALQKRAGALKLADPAYLAEVAARGKGGSLWSPPPVPPAPPKKKPAVDKKRCEDAATCGELTAIPGSPLWLVQTANSRGDFYHETRTLWDPATGEYVRRDGAKLARSKAVPPDGDADTDYGGLRVSTSGLLSHGGAIFDSAKVHHAPREQGGEGDGGGSATSCGWTDGGWRIAGPTDIGR